VSIDPAIFEIALIGSAFAALAAYHWRLWALNRSSPETTAMGRHRLVRHAWARMIQTGGREILVVQTLRNWIMSSTFLASTAILFALGLLGAAFTTDKLSQLAHGLNFFGNQGGQLLLLKALLLVVDFLAGFFNFSLAIRAFIHAGFAINLPDKQGLGHDVGAKELERGALHYTLGMRSYYLAIPLSLWFFGPVWMFAGTVLLVLVLYRVD